MTVKSLQLKIDQLQLDQKNPRILEAGNQREALQRILDDQRSKLVNLADDIVQHGLSPTDNLIVLRSSEGRKKFVVLEGNRRFAALKILTNPAVLADLDVSPRIKRRLTDCAAQFKQKYGTEFGTISCREVESRQEARMWISRRHGTGQDGVGLERWGQSKLLDLRATIWRLKRSILCRSSEVLRMLKVMTSESRTFFQHLSDC